MIDLTAEHRRTLRANAHSLKPVVYIAEQGLVASVLAEIDTSLKAHELIKIRVYGDDREARDAYLQQICTELDAAPVQHIGKLLVIWRPAPAAVPEPKRRGVSGNRNGRSTKRSQQGSTRK